MMQQYRSLKQKHPDSLLFFRLGDFYEMFFEDAECAARELQITLTARDAGKGNKAPMCGVPYHAVNRYLSRLLRKGYKVTIAEQMEEAGKGKKLVLRDVIRTITPGTILDDALLDEKKNNYLACVVASKEGELALAYSDISTGELKVTQTNAKNEEHLLNELKRLSPSECLLPPEIKNTALHEKIKNNTACSVTFPDEHAFSPREAEKILRGHFAPGILLRLKSKENAPSLIACGVLLYYASTTQKTTSSHFTSIVTYLLSDVMHLDEATRRNLELTQNLRDGTAKNTLFGTLDNCKTAPGSRKLRSWIEQPLRNKNEIEKRHDAVEELLKNFKVRANLRGLLSSVYDLERILSKIVYGTCMPRDLSALKSTFFVFPEIKQCLQALSSPLLSQCHENFDTLVDMHAQLVSALNDDLPSGLHDGGIMKEGYSNEVDELRRAAREGKTMARDFEQRERERTTIKSLKVGFNNVFGYFIEVTKPQLLLVPQDYIRKQTTANGERFFTDELKSLEEKILGAQEKLVRLEYELFHDLRKKIINESARIKTSCDVLSILDIASSHADYAHHNNFVKPAITDNGALHIKEGRHPIVELECRESPFVSNDTRLDARENNLMLITGPNMAGKSTYIRQVALNTLLAHAGLFVPAKEASICLVDSIFTRVGARDDLSSGMSTFMVEMTETGYILEHATAQSLILLDEVGRGTSTYDGLSIAWAVAEYIYTHIRAKTLFATHYHELTRLADEHDGIKNFNVAVKEEGDRVIFLRKIMEGPIDKSYGIFVARLAGLPPDVLNRARLLLSGFEKNGKTACLSADMALADASDEKPHEPRTETLPHLFDKNAAQLALFDNKLHSVLNELKQLSIDDMTPLEALNKLSELKEKAAKKAGGSYAKKK